MCPDPNTKTARVVTIQILTPDDAHASWAIDCVPNAMMLRGGKFSQNPFLFPHVRRGRRSGRKGRLAGNKNRRFK